MSRDWLKWVAILASILLCTTLLPTQQAAARPIPDDGSESGIGGAGSWGDGSDSHARYPNAYANLDPDGNVVVNGKVFSVSKVYRNLHGHVGIEYTEMAKVLDLYNWTGLKYRDTSMSDAYVHNITDSLAKSKQCQYRGGRDLYCPQAPEVDKVWLGSRMFRTTFVFSWDDSTANGEWVGDGYYKRDDGRKIVRFDHVVPYLGGMMTVTSSGLVMIYLPDRTAPLSAADMCVLHNQYGNCDISQFILPEAYGTNGENVVHAVLGWQMDTRQFGTDLYRDMIQNLNVNGLRYSGKQPTFLQRLDQGATFVAIVLPALLLAEELGGIAVFALQYYFPEDAVYVSTAELELAEAGYLQDRLSLQGVTTAEARQAAERLGIDSSLVLAPGDAAPAEGWWWKVRTMSDRSATIQSRRGDELFQIGPNTWLAKEYAPYEGGPFLDGFNPPWLIEHKGGYNWMVDKDTGLIIQSFIDGKNKKFNEIIKQIDRQVVAMNRTGLKLEWVFTEGESDKFGWALLNYLQETRPEIYKSINDGRIKITVE